jgi:hypothetical protein
MPRLTLRTLLAYLDDTLDPHQARSLGRKVAESPDAKQLIERIKKVTRRRRLHAPVPTSPNDDVSDPNTVAEFLSNNLPPDQLKQFETACLASDVHLAEVAACHQILTLVMTEPVRVPPTANQRMYKLVEPPASDPGRKPGKGIPIAGTPAPAADHSEGDDPDAALLLGMKRYTSSASWGGRLRLVGAVFALLVFLTVAVFMALPPSSPVPLETSTAVSYASSSSSSGVGGPDTRVPIAPAPVPVVPKSEPITEPKTEPKVDPKSDPGLGLGERVQPPLPGRELVGRLETANVLVLTRSPDAMAAWMRIEPTDAGVFTSDDVMALPGYKADVKLISDVVVTLWGHVPEQVPFDDLAQVMARLRVLESRVVFHPPSGRFDSDLTLKHGRIYLSTRKPGGASLRVRVGNEVFDVQLADDKSEVMMQTNTAFVPGAPLAREGGEKPRTEFRLAITRGTATVSVPDRFKKFEVLGAGSELTWDSKTNVIAGPKQFPKGDPLTLRDGMLLEGDYGKAIQKALSDTAGRLTQRDGIRVLLEGRINFLDLPLISKPTEFQVMVAVNAVRFAIYAYAAIADGNDAPAILANLYDQLTNTERDFARQAAVTAVSAWIGRDPQNTRMMIGVMVEKKRLPEEDADHIAMLLRGFSSLSSGDVSAVDTLIKDLDDSNIVIRECALANLIAFFDPQTVKDPALRLSVAARGQPGYEAALKKWRDHGEEIKKRMLQQKK